jgi:hypothetical protein
MMLGYTLAAPRPIAGGDMLGRLAGAAAAIGLRRLAAAIDRWRYRPAIAQILEEFELADCLRRMSHVAGNPETFRLAASRLRVTCRSISEQAFFDRLVSELTFRSHVNDVVRRILDLPPDDSGNPA